MDPSRPIVRKFAAWLSLWLTIPLEFLSTPRRKLGLTLPIRVAFAFVFVFTVFALVTALLWHRHAHPAWEQILKVAGAAAVLIVLGATLVQFLVRWWITTAGTRFPDIDDAWGQGLTAIAAAGFDLREIPLFLVLGVAEEQGARSLLAAAGVGMEVVAVPAGEVSGVHWFAGPECAVLVVARAGRLNSLVARANASPRGAGSASVQPAEPKTGTSTPHGPTRGSARTGLEQTGAESPDASLRLTEAETEDASARLAHVARRLLDERLPDCPINGILTVVPFDLVSRGDHEVGEMQTAVSADLATLRSELHLRCQVVLLVGGMEREDGFRELQRRLGSKIVNEQQFGKGYNPQCQPIDEELVAVSQHACGAFEDWTYHLFSRRGDQRLRNPRGNRQLYSLVCKIRSVQQRIENLVVNGFSATSETVGLAHMFSGCYFGATGDAKDRQAFVAGIFKNRLQTQHKLVEWTPAAIAKNERYQLIANLLVAVDIVLLSVILTLVVMGCT
jgi:hypothetical protein